MRKDCTLLLLFLILFSSFSHGQSLKLWGATAEGGYFKGGTLFSINADGSDFKKHYDFKADAGFTPLYTHLVLGGDGYLYGLTSEGGKYSDGVLFRINLEDDYFERVYEFQNYPDIFL